MPPPLSSLCGRRTVLRRPADNVAAVSHGQHVPTPTAGAVWRANTAVSKAAWWPLTLKVVSESSVTWATSVPSLVFLGLSVLDLGPMYTTDSRQTKASLNVRGGYNNQRVTHIMAFVMVHSLVWLVFNGTFSTYGLCRATDVSRWSIAVTPCTGCANKKQSPRTNCISSEL